MTCIFSFYGMEYKCVSQTIKYTYLFPLSHFTNTFFPLKYMFLRFPGIFLSNKNIKAGIRTSTSRGKGASQN